MFEEIKKSYRNLAQKPFVAYVGTLTLAWALYLLVIAQPSYTTETRVIVRENREAAPGIIPGIAASLVGGGIKSSLEDAYVLVDYLQSSSLVSEIDTQLNLRAHFSTPSLDIFRRLGRNAASEDLHAYFLRHVKINVIPESSIVTIEVNAFEPAFAQKLAQALVTASEKAINNLNNRMVTAQTTLASNELSKARTNLTAARRKLLNFQATNNIIDPTGEVFSRLTSLAALDERLVQKRAELRIKQQFIREDAFDIRTLQQEITGLEAQRTQENQRLINSSGASDPQGIAAAAQAYEEVKLEADFALQTFTAALALDEKAKLDSARQAKFLLQISQPHLPEAHSFPSLFINTLTAFAVLSLFYGIIRLIIATIRDHTI